jgi:cyclopropane-fatty-acyl-phospholipid synthase
MATQAEVARGYDPIDRIHEAAFGTFADVSAAFYQGDFSMTLREAQRRKHEFILQQLGLQPGDRLLDIGCGWGPLLEAARSRGIDGRGITLSPAQCRRCEAEGLDVDLKDWKDLDPAKTGGFDGVASVGAFEHFVGPDEALDGGRDAVYGDFFRLCAELLPDDGRLFLQTMTWGERVPHPEELDIHAPKLSDQWVMGYLAYLYPGSWLPDGLEHIVACAEPWFELTFESNGAADYLQTFDEWGRALDRLGWRKWWIMAPHFARGLFDRDLARTLTALRYGCARLCFERGIFSHFRMVFRKT